MEPITDPRAIWANRSSALVDMVLAGLLTIGAIAEAATAHADRLPLAATLLVTVAIPVAWRRTATIPAIGAMLLPLAIAALADVVVLESASAASALVVMTYSAGAWRPLRTALLGLALSLVAVPLLLARYELSRGIVLAITAQFVAAWLVGRVMRARRDRVFRSVEAEVRNDLEGRRRIDDVLTAERRRMGAELHDIISHGVSSMVVQAAAAGAATDDDPVAAMRVLASVQELGRQVERELYRLLGLLRRSDDCVMQGGDQSTVSIDVARDPRALWPSRWWPPTGGVADTSGAIAATFIGLGAAIAAGVTAPIALAAGGLQTLAIAGRRRAPLAALVVGSSVVPVGHAAGLDASPVHLYTWMFLVYSCAAWSYRRKAVAGLAVSLAVTEWVAVTAEGAVLAPWPMAVALAAWAVGRLMRAEVVELSRSTERRQRSAARREDQIRRELDGQRRAVARELHDVVSHGVAVMTVQAAVAEATVEREPTVAHDAIDAIQLAGYRALEELTHLLGAWGTEGRVPALSPVPQMRDIEALVDRVRASGLDVDLRIRGVPTPLPAGVAVTAYRLVQESLTNAGRYGDHGGAEVSLEYEADDIHITITNAMARRAPALGTGHGLIGLRERVAVCDGEVVAGPCDGDRFVVDARLPLPS